MKFKKSKLIIAIMLIIGIVLPIYSFAENTVNNTETQNIQEDVFKQISAPNLLLAETNSGRILYERNYKGMTILNPGSISSPRQPGGAHTYAILEVDSYGRFQINMREI